jgi:hypothetical protein
VLELSERLADRVELRVIVGRHLRSSHCASFDRSTQS